MQDIIFEIPIVVKSVKDKRLFSPTPTLIETVCEDFNPRADELMAIAREEVPMLCNLHMFRVKNRAFMRAQCFVDITPEMRLAIIKEVDAQCSDGWGEGFGQITFKGHGVCCREGYNVHTWIHGWREIQEAKLNQQKEPAHE